MRLKAVISLFKDTFAEWNEDKVSLWAAALAYYTIFSLAPLLLIVIAIAGAVFGEQAAQGQIINQIQGVIGKQGAEAVQAILANANKPGSGGTIGTIFGVITLLLGASGVFGQLQAALNTIWEVKPKPKQAIWGFIQSRFLSFASVLVLGFLLLVSLVLSTVLAGISTYFNSFFPDAILLGKVVNFIVSFGSITLLFAAIFKFLPDVELRWRDLWVGAAFTSLLFSIGKYFIGLYLGNSGVASTYGAAASIVVILIWVFYSAQIILFGAEFTQVYAKHRGSGIRPSRHAVRVDQSETDSPDTPQASQSEFHALTQPGSSQRPAYGRYLVALLGSVFAITGLNRRSRRRRYR